MIYRGDVEVEIPNVSLPEFVLHRAARLGGKPALIDGPTGRTLSYAQLDDAVRHAAAGLAERGLRKGDALAIYSPNLPEYAVAYLAVASLGGINTTVNPQYTADELANQLDDADAIFLLTIPQLLDKAIEAARRSSVREIFVFGASEGATPFADLLDNDGRPPAVEIDPHEDVVALPYSSGTTGLPKGVMLTHRNLVANICQCRANLTITQDDVIIAVLPFYHIYGMEVILNACLYHGATVVTMPRFDFESFLRTVQDYRVTHAFLVPPIILALAKHPQVDQYDLSSLRSIDSGAAPLSAQLTAACAERLNCLVRQGYGMTETSPVTHGQPLGRERAGSIGMCLHSTESKIVDVVTGAELGAGEQGEICVRGPQVMKGYLKRPDATAAMIDPDGWLHTGDIGYADEDGYFYVVDRLKELIKYKGLQVAPAELEAVLISHPAIADAAVIPSPDEEAGEVPKAFVVLKTPITPDEIMAYVAERVAPYKKIRRLEIVDQIPKSPSGKILRRVLIERERAATAPMGRA